MLLPLEALVVLVETPSEEEESCGMIGGDTNWLVEFVVLPHRPPSPSRRCRP